MATIVWFRNDLRLQDNPALSHAIERGQPVIPVFIWAPEEEGDWPPGASHRWWLHHSLQSLRDDLASRGSRLIIRTGPTHTVFRELANTTGADAIVWNRRFHPALADRDEELLRAFRSDNLGAVAFPSRILHDPDTVRTTTGGPYHVFTPFWKRFTDILQETLAAQPPLPIPALRGSDPEAWPDSTPLETLQLLPGVDRERGFHAAWAPGETAACDRLDHFVEKLAAQYATHRNRPDIDGTSRLSPYLQHGELSPRQVWHRVTTTAPKAAKEDANAFLRQLGWREFSYHVLYHYPSTPLQPLKEKFTDMQWTTNDEMLQRWQQGMTGYPLVDAGMRQLTETGWMHNRVRMVVASFLTKDLMVGWQEGARWFWDTLVDADLANNTMGWQWAAGCGADSQPFFRIFNPVTQSKRFDPRGEYISRYVPELRTLPASHIHTPWKTAADELARAGIHLGSTYPEPVVDHAQAREKAVLAYHHFK